MSRPAQNSLNIRDLGNGVFYLSGQCLGRQIRVKGPDLEALEKKRDALQKEIDDARALAETKPVARYTSLTPEQLTRAAALFLKFASKPHSLEEYAEAGLAVLGEAKLMEVTAARDLWKSHQEMILKLQKGTVSRNVDTLNKFIEKAAPKYVSDITNPAIEDFCNVTAIEGKDGSASLYSAITRASSLRAFLNFCVKKKFIRHSPFAMDMETLHKLAKKQKGRASILSPDKAIALMDAALTTDPRMVPFFIFALWGFARVREVRRMMGRDIKLDRATPFFEPESLKLGTPSYRTTNIPANMLPLLKECIAQGLIKEGKKIFFEDKAFRRVREAAGLVQFTPWDSKGNRRIVKTEWEQSIMRHTGISMLYQHFSALADAGKFTEDSAIAAVTRQAGNSESVAFADYINIPNARDAAKFYAYTPRLKMIAQPVAQRVA